LTQFSHDQLEALWVNAGGPDNYADVAAAIAEAESSGDSTRINNTAYPSKPNYSPPKPGNKPEYSVGLWQVNIYVFKQYTEAQMLDPAKNAAAAVAISDHGVNFNPWTTFKNGAYLGHLTGVSPGGTITFTPGPSGDTAAAQAHRGWHQINLALSRSLPSAIFHSERLGASTAALLARRRK
jgi:hypothetical protein